MEFQMDSCVLVVTTYKKVLDFGKELPTEREFSNFVDFYAVEILIPVITFPRNLKTHLEVILLTL